MSRVNVYRESVLQTGYDFVKARVLHVAFSLDLFESLGSGTKSALTLAEELKANARSLELFLNAVVSVGFLDSDGLGYRNTKFGREIFIKGKPLYIGDFIRLQAKSAEDWMSLKQSVLSGEPLDQPDFFKTADNSAVGAFACAMHNTAMGHADLLSRKLSLDGLKTLLDVGGGPGTFTIHFLKANPTLRATIFDLPATLETTRRFVADAGLTDRVSFQAGNFNQDAFQGMFDVCFLSHIIHGLDALQNKMLFEKIFAVLNSGARFIVQDFFLNADRKSPQFSALFALNMLIHTRGGRTYTFDEAEGWLREAGFQSITRSTLKLPRSISLLLAEKP